MRYYDFALTDALTGKPLLRPDGTQYRWTSYPNGKFDGGALNIAFDLPVTVGQIPMGQGGITIEGVALEDLAIAKQFAAEVTNGKVASGANLTLKGGFGAGLPLATPAQQGTILTGMVFQSWGNWIGTDMALSFIPLPPVYSYNRPGNIVWIWNKGQTVQAALQNCLSVAYPNAKLQFSLQSTVTAVRPDHAYFATFGQLAQHVQQLTQTNAYPGVSMVHVGASITIFDNAQNVPTITLQFADLVGQPAWIDINTIQVDVALRGDIQVGNLIKFPSGFHGTPGLVTTTANSSPAFFKYKSLVQGVFRVQSMRHVGNFRDPDGTAWVTKMQCIPEAFNGS